MPAGVAAEVLMPRLSDSMEEGTILKWMKSVGDEVAVGEELVEIETDKANMVYESDLAGTLVEIVAAEDETVPIGGVIARIGEPGAVVPDAESGASQAEPPDSESAAQNATGPVKASPLARRLAREANIDLSEVDATGPGGRVTKADVERTLSADGAPDHPSPRGQAPSALNLSRAPAGRPTGDGARGETTTVELTKLQQTVSRRMAESKATAPHFHLSTEVDMTRVVAARAKIKAAAGDDLVPSVNDMVVKACAIALREYPRANGAYRDGKLELYSRVNIGIAVAAQHALVVPTLVDADRKGLTQIATETLSLVERVRAGKITPPELSGATFTVSNLGMYGISSFAAVINPPQAAILAVGEIAEKPVVRNGDIAIAQMMDVTLACDHRILYGADGAVLLGRVRELLEEPLELAL